MSNPDVVLLYKVELRTSYFCTVQGNANPISDLFRASRQCYQSPGVLESGFFCWHRYCFELGNVSAFIKHGIGHNCEIGKIIWTFGLPIDVGKCLT